MPNTKQQTATGVETTPDANQPEATEDRVARSEEFAAQHLVLTQAALADETDRHNELAQERRWLLHPSERALALAGNAFAVEDTFTGAGRVFVKEAPLPHARPVRSAADLRVRPLKGSGFAFDLLAAPNETDPMWHTIAYEGGDAGRIAALHEWQQSRRPQTANHAVPLFLSNTWGDRSRDGRINEPFLADEIAAAARMGVDVLQIDDGWQRGTTCNSVHRDAGGVWEGFWNADPEFWQPHPERLPNGLDPIVTQVRDAGMRLGLWFAPDSWADFRNWQRDADQIADLYRRHGISFIKIDGVKALTTEGATNLRRFFDAALATTGGEVVFDLDVTAGVRPGYFGALDVGPLFVENRYTDWHNYWPHQTLRNVWSLARWVDPRRMRMEFLNHTRNADQYANDPLAPSAWSPAALFATVMFTNPLGWFEVSNLPAGYIEEVAPLVATWRECREALFGGAILPIGRQPDGHAWTGFASLARDGQEAFALVFRELSDAPETTIPVPGLAATGDWEVIGGTGTISSAAGRLNVSVPEKLGFVFARMA